MFRRVSLPWGLSVVTVLEKPAARGLTAQG
jgi:hypothetical protein